MACSRSTKTSRPLACRYSMVSHVISRFSSGVVSERAFHIEQARLDDDHSDGNAALVAHDELQIGPSLRPSRRGRACGRRAPASSVGIDGSESRGQIGDKLVGSGEADLGVAHAKGRPCAAATARHSVPRSPDRAAASRHAGWYRTARLFGLWSRSLLSTKTGGWARDDCIAATTPIFIIT